MLGDMVLESEKSISIFPEAQNLLVGSELKGQPHIPQRFSLFIVILSPLTALAL